MANLSQPYKWFNTVAFNNGTGVDVHDPGATGQAYVTKVTLTIVAHVNGKFAGLQDSTGTPIIYCKHIDATAATGVLDVITWDFGKGGIPMALGKKVQAISEASGFATTAAYLYVEGYDIRVE
jgi:hypothetical protein